MLTQEELINAIADLIRQARQHAGYTLEKLAEKSNIDYSTANLIENGKQNPRVYTVYKLLYSLDIDIVKLLNNANNKMSDRRTFMLNKLENLDNGTIEALCELISKFEIIKK